MSILTLSPSRPEKNIIKTIFDIGISLNVSGDLQIFFVRMVRVQKKRRLSFEQLELLASNGFRVTGSQFASTRQARVAFDKKICVQSFIEIPLAISSGLKVLVVR